MNCPRCNGRGKIQRCIGHEGRGAIFNCNVCNGAGEVAGMTPAEVVTHETAYRDDSKLIKPESIR